MATTIIPKAARGQSADMPNSGAVNLPSIPFDDELLDDPAGDRAACRADAYDQAAKDTTRLLVKRARGLFNDYGDNANHILSLCDIGARSSSDSGDCEAEAVFHAIRLIYSKHGTAWYEMNGVVEALIDRLPQEGGAA